MLLRSRDWFQIPFGLLFVGAGLMAMFSILVTPSDQAAPPPALMALFFLPFLLIGAYFSVGHLFWERWVRSRSSYALTDQRAIIVQNRLQKNVRTIMVKDILDVSLTVGRDGVGTITFNESQNPWGPWMAWGMWGFSAAPAFERIDNASAVYALVAQTRAGLHR